MSTIIEGIYHTHKVDFKFIKVLQQILEEESLIKDAYIEYLKNHVKWFLNHHEDAISDFQEKVDKKYGHKINGTTKKNSVQKSLF